jgi:hypothetical protein
MEESQWHLFYIEEADPTMGYTWWLIKDTKYCGQPNPKRKQVKQDNE